MSIVVRDRDSGLIKIYSKGADNVIKARLSSKSKVNLDSQLRKFSLIGLRTLLVAMRTVSEKEYESFQKSMNSLPSHNNEEAANKLIADLESGLFVIGATAVLDKLQQDVPETIRDLIRANIKVWMLTGDKMETAENIAKSCNLIQPKFSVLKLERPAGVEHMSPEDAERRINDIANRAEELQKRSVPKAFLIEGADLSVVLSS